VHMVLEFIEQTEPASFSPEQWRQMLRSRRPNLRPVPTPLGKTPGTPAKPVLVA